MSAPQSTPRRASRRDLLRLGGVTALTALGLLAACGPAAATTVATAGSSTAATSAVATSAANRASVAAGATTNASLPAVKTTAVTSSTASAAPSANVAGKAGELSFALWDNNHFDVEQQMVDAFQKADPSIKISVEHTVTDYQTKLEAQLAGDAAPDVYWINTSFFPALAINGSLVNLSPLIARDKVAMTDYGPTYIDYFTYQNKLLGFPKDWDTVALLYNKDLFDQAGQPYPNANWTWSPSGGGDLLVAAQKLTNAAAHQYGLVSQPAGQPFWWNFVWMNGGDILDKPWGTKVALDTPAAMDALQWCAQLATKYQVSPTAAELASQSADQTFWTGHAAMITAGDWVLLNYQKQIGTRFKWDVAPLPSGPNGRISETNSLAYGVWSGGKHLDDAWTFTRWLGKEGEILLAQGGAVFPAYLPAVDDFVKSKPDLNLKIYADERANAHPIPVSPYIDQVNSAINPEMQALWKGTETVQVAVQRISQQLNQVLAKTPGH